MHKHHWFEQNNIFIIAKRKKFQMYSYSDLELLHCINKKHLLLVPCQCRPAVIFQSCLVQQMEQSVEQWLDWQRERLDWKKKKNPNKTEEDKWSEKERGTKIHIEDSTYIRIVSSHDVSDDNRSIFKF